MVWNALPSFEFIAENSPLFDSVNRSPKLFVVRPHTVRNKCHSERKSGGPHDECCNPCAEALREVGDFENASVRVFVATLLIFARRLGPELRPIQKCAEPLHI